MVLDSDFPDFFDLNHLEEGPHVAVSDLGADEVSKESDRSVGSEQTKKERRAKQLLAPT